jgi:hypothetical protein
VPKAGAAPRFRLFAANFLQLTHGLMNCLFRGNAELFNGHSQRPGLEFKADGDGAHRCHDLRLSDIYDLSRRVIGTVRRDRRQSADGAHLAIGKRLFSINLFRVHGCLAAIGGGTHSWALVIVAESQP